MNHLDNCIICPKCQTKTMRKSIGKGHGEYFDDKCHQYFTIDELVNQWNYDLGDFGDIMNMSPDFIKSVGDYIWERDDLGKWLEDNFPVDLLSMWEDDTVSEMFEEIPDNEFPWYSLKERDEAYQVVTEMLLGIPSWASEDYSVDTGALHG